MNELIEELNEKQKEAVKTTTGPLLIMAGAGSGKTKTLTVRLAYLIKEKQINPNNILAITFTNKAAKEMKDRIYNILGNMTHFIQISTFHSFGLKIIKENYELLNYKKNFTILDSDDSLTLIKRIIKDQNLDSKQYDPKLIKSKISDSKNNLVDYNDYEKYCNNTYEKKIALIYKNYQEKLIINNSLDFDDLLMLPIKLFSKNSNILKQYQEQYQYIMVDEYQDTNEAQYILTKMISAKYKNICVVGDADQSIYSWRGANYQNILNFEKDYKDAKTIFLEENYRSTKNILTAANNVIKNNKKRKDKNLWTDNNTGKNIVYYRAVDELEEAFYVTNKIKILIKAGINPKDIAVLYRTNAQSRTIEESLLKENIPYKIIGGFYFYNRKEIKDLISYLKLIHNPNDDVSLLRIINVPKRGIGKQTVDKMLKLSKQNQTSIYNVLEEISPKFKKMIDYLISIKDTTNLAKFIETVIEKTELIESLKEDINKEIKQENVEEFKSIAKNFDDNLGIVSLEDFLNEISLVSDKEEYKNNNNVVTLMSVHSSKGLEYKMVFLIGMDEGLFPHQNSFMDPEQLEEERRLCYVAITRAKEELWILGTFKRLIYGQTKVYLPSRFILEMKDDIIIETNLENKIRKNKIEIKKQDTEYSVSDKVEHETLGVGIIVKIKDDLLDIAFDYPHGIKKILKDYPKIRKVK